MQQQFAYWLKVSRPRFWIYVFGPFLIGAVAAVENRAELLNSKFLAFAVFFLFPANLLIYGINDIFDYETDKLNAKKQEYETLVGPNQRRNLWVAIIIATLPFLVLTSFQSTRSVLSMVMFLFFSIFYSAPPIRAKKLPLLDSAFNILYVFPGIFAYYLLGGQNLIWEVVVAGACWTAAMHAYSAVPDITADKEAGLDTIATWLGGKATLIFCLVMYALAGLLTLKYLGIFSMAAAVAYVAMIILSLNNYSEQNVFKVYRYFPWLNTAIGFALFWYIAAPKFF